MINPVQSARLRTTGTFTFKYGRLEVCQAPPFPRCWMQARLTFLDYPDPAVMSLPVRWKPSCLAG